MWTLVKLMDITAFVSRNIVARAVRPKSSVLYATVCSTQNTVQTCVVIIIRSNDSFRLFCHAPNLAAAMT